MLRTFQRMPPSQRERLATEATRHPLASPEIGYEPWYLKRWHCLPDGYLSARSVALYDRLIRRLYALGRERAAAAHVAAYVGEGPVLDVGCGTGSLMARLRRLAPDASFQGIDLSPFAVAAANRRLGTFDAPAVVHGDGRATPFDDNAFQLVVMSHVLGHVPGDVGAALTAEAARVLATGGTLITVEHRWHGVRPAGFRRTARQGAAGGAVQVEAWSAT